MNKMMIEAIQNLTIDDIGSFTEFELLFKERKKQLKAEKKTLLEEDKKNKTAEKTIKKMEKQKEQAHKDEVKAQKLAERHRIRAENAQHKAHIAREARITKDKELKQRFGNIEEQFEDCAAVPSEFEREFDEQPHPETDFEIDSDLD